MHKTTTRRAFIIVVGSAIGAVASRFGWLTPGAEPIATAAETPTGERYGDFLVLPPGSPIPENVAVPADGVSLENLQNEELPLTKSSSFETLEEVARNVTFPIYQLADAPDVLHPGGGVIFWTNKQRVSSASYNYKFYAEKVGLWVTAVTVDAREAYPVPVPIWEGSAPDGSLLQVEKTDLLPEPGLLQETNIGHVGSWTNSGILYSVIVRSKISRSEIADLFGRLKTVAT